MQDPPRQTDLTVAGFAPLKVFLSTNKDVCGFLSPLCMVLLLASQHL